MLGAVAAGSDVNAGDGRAPVRLGLQQIRVDALKTIDVAAEGRGVGVSAEEAVVAPLP